MNHKILCVDLDATLLCDDKSITQKNREAIHRMLEAGHYIALEPEDRLKQQEKLQENWG